MLSDVLVKDKPQDVSYMGVHRKLISLQMEHEDASNLHKNNDSGISGLCMKKLERPPSGGRVNRPVILCPST